ncbi:MAG: hypothetical protein RIS73_1055 [Bacteroidota bacterium]
MKKKLTYYDGLYGDLNYRPKGNYIFWELIETRSKGFDWVIKPHLHAHLYQVFCIESGKVVLASSAQSQSLQIPCVLVIPPNTLHGLQYSATVKGNILTISDAVFDGLFPSSASLSLEFETLKCIGLQAASFKKIRLLINEINEELFADKTDKKLMLDTLLRQLFISLHRLALVNDTGSLKDTNATLQYYRRFIQSVKTNDKQKSIPAFAKELGITAVHLNRICNQVCGKAALLIVQEHLIEQAKNYLSHTSYTIAEIAYLLNFEYPNYFARLFKKLNGVSPKEYRRRL